ncbi:mitochondrial transcription rescue factor 1 isoform X2 [Monomorium pharaonis]|uniref:mitochondrial transcription rescue factor 1 isoform X2 n=1 Tax=Monomorium pharaonis TaxID=307658 RepID=UPI00063FCEA5|nr:mitochondrial transcription rescue factor 1 isoform X2 [Monomorium pharaonis]
MNGIRRPVHRERIAFEAHQTSSGQPCRTVVSQEKDKDEDSEEEDDDEEAPVGSKVMKIKTNSLRLDLVSKTAFKMSRNKIEEIFYESRFRINGNKVLKKSKEVKVGDEIDIILHQNVDNPRLLVINRIVILSISPMKNETQIQIKLSVDKNLLIENYENYISV